MAKYKYVEQKPCPACNHDLQVNIGQTPATKGVTTGGVLLGYWIFQAGKREMKDRPTYYCPNCGYFAEAHFSTGHVYKSQKQKTTPKRLFTYMWVALYAFFLYAISNTNYSDSGLTIRVYIWTTVIFALPFIIPRLFRWLRKKEVHKFLISSIKKMIYRGNENID